MMKKRVYDIAFKQMAVALSDTKGSVKEAAEELDIDPGRISNWKNQYKSGGTTVIPSVALSNEQKEIRRLQKELREAQQERDILKRRSASFPGETGDIQIYKGFIRLNIP